jgi:hypothetical protein
MSENEYAALIDRLPPSRRGAFDVLAERGQLTDLEVHAALGRDGDQGPTRARIAELRQAGLVRQVGKRGGRKLWEVTPPAEVEAAAEAVGKKGPRRRPVADRDLDERVATFHELLSDPEVQEAVEDPSGSSTKRQRAKVKRATERAKRERRRQLKKMDADNHPSVEAMRLRHAVEDAGDYLRSLRAFNEEDWERRMLLGEELVFGPEWGNILREIEELERQADETWELIARRSGVPSRREVDIELDAEDADYEELAAANGGGVADLIERLGGTTRLALPPAKDVSGTD